MVNFRATDYFRRTLTRLEGPTHALRCLGSEEIDENDETDFKGLIDARHMHALQVGRQTMSQFGHGKYTVKVMIWPNAGFTGLLQDNSLPTTGQIMCSYIMPTKARYAALAHLKKLERDNAQVSQNVSTFTGEHNALLAADLDTDNALAIGADENAMNSGHKGAKVIRFSYDSNFNVYGQAEHLVDFRGLILDGPDGDYDEPHETKAYTLLSDSQDHFGVLPRYEASINPTIDENGNTIVNKEWDMPLNRYKVFGETQQIQPVTYSLSRSSEVGDDITNANIIQATFTGIEALGGLIKISIPSLLQLGDFTANNNDFNVYATVTEHSWTPMKR